MNLPNLPTDNLYKFIALAGLVVILLSIVLPNIALHNLRLELLKTNGELSVLQAEYDFLREEHNSVENHPNLEEAAKHREKMKELRVRTLQLKSKDESERFLHRQTIVWQSVAAIGLFVGAGMVTFGFKLWYERVQKYQDMILKKDAGELPHDEIQKTSPASSPSGSEDSTSAASSASS